MCEAAALARDNKADLDLAITTRQSVRTFRPDPVDRATVEEILALASRSPSGSNIQPWKVRVLADEPRAKLTQAILGAIASDGHEGSRREWNYYPQRWREPFLGRRRRIGWTCIGAIMTAARARGLDTRAQDSPTCTRSIRGVTDIPQNEVVICALALGCADLSASVNRLETERASVTEFITFHSF
jgi:nitroreductase